MSVEAWTITPEYTISGTGPYAITHPYSGGSILAYVRLDTGLLLLNTSEFSVSPDGADIEGNLTLSPTIAATHTGRKLLIDRATPDEQGWLAVLGEREAGLAAQLDRMVQATQELRARGAGTLRIRGVLDAFEWPDGTVPIRDGSRVKAGPTATAIADAQTRATEAAASAAAAAASAAEALQRELSMLRDRGNWATSLLYSPSDIVTINGSAYICIASHFATVFATDLASARWRIFAAKGDGGAGSGDMLKTENLSGLTNYPQARTNLGLQALAIKALAAFADLDPSAIITDVETLAANKVANAIPTAKAVTDYVDPMQWQYVGSQVITNDATGLVTGLGGFKDIGLLVLGSTSTINGNRQVRVGTSGGILSTNIYRWAQGALTNRLRMNDGSSSARSFYLEIRGFNTTEAAKRLKANGSFNAADAPVAIESALAFDRLQVTDEGGANNINGGTIHVWGRV